MSNKLLGTTCIVGTIALAACGGGNSDGLISKEEQALRVFADVDGDGIGDQDVADVLAAGGELNAREVSERSLAQLFADDTYTLEDGTLALKGDGDDLLVTLTTYTGAKETFRVVNAAAIAEDQVTIETDTYYFSLFLANGFTIADLLDNTTTKGYALRVGVYYDIFDDGGSVEYRSVMGTETRDAMIEQLKAGNVIASYDGFGSVNVRRDGAGWSTYNGNIRGDVSMTANFSSQSISGALGVGDSLYYEERAGDVVDVGASGSVAGTILMNEASIQSNGFSGTMSPDATLIASDPGISAFSAELDYSGAFYGPDADMVGGTMGGTAEVEGTNYIGIGSFTGYRD